jgi:NUMOD3 motif
MEYYTYAYLREDRTPYYIGKGTGDRIYSTNRKGLKPPKDKSRIIYLKQNLTEEEAFKHEIYMIDVFGRKDLGTGILHNRTYGGEGPSGAIRSEETRIKIGEAHKGKNPSEETRRKMSEAQKGNTKMLGKTHSEETRKKIGEASKGKTASEESRKKMSESGKVKIFSKEHRRKMSESGKVKIFSKEHRRKLSEAGKGKRWWNDGCGNRKFVVEYPGDGWKPGMK